MAVDRPLSSAGLYNDVLRSSRHSGSAVYRPTSGKKNALPPSKHLTDFSKCLKKQNKKF